MNSLFFKIYHANLAFSAIEESDLAEVIDKTYFPLLNLIQQYNIKMGLELSGYSLEKIQQLRPEWIQKFKILHKKGLVELIGSGYMQIIGPIVPYEVNILNQQIGLEIYKAILGIIPDIAFVNEQTFSSSMIDIYTEVGYKAIAMEWNNAYTIHHKNWKLSYGFQSVFVQGIYTKIPILWTDSIIFQQYQRMVHNEINLQSYINFIQSKINLGYKAIPIYASDLEIFNYRPGRFETETTILNNEWSNIATISNELQKLGDFQLPSEILQKTLNKDIILILTNSANPIIIKKQEKYSLSRWSACGRGANLINTLCFQYLKTNCYDAKQLLQYWGSDYRTHTTQKKWKNALDFFKLKLPKTSSNLARGIESNKLTSNNPFDLEFKYNNYVITFNKKKGLTLKSIKYKNNFLEFGTVEHGKLHFISNTADFYTGTTVIESASGKKITNLSEVNNYTFEQNDMHCYKLSTKIELKNIAIEERSWIIDTKHNILTFEAQLDVKQFVLGSIRIGALTLFPQNMNKNFWYECKNGGQYFERHKINQNITHSKAKSLLQSSNGGIGVTDGVLRFGIDETIICKIDIDREYSYPFIMLENNCDLETYLTRVNFSVQELDDTLKENYSQKCFKLRYHITLS